MRVPSGEKATELTRTLPLDFTLSVSSSLPLCASHTLAAESALPVTMRVPSCEKATELTGDPTLSVSCSTAVGEETVAEAVSFCAVEATGKDVPVGVGRFGPSFS